MFWSRLRCHFCGARSQHAKGTLEFQCSSCEAVNFYDKNGVIIDTPVARTSQALPPPKPISFTKPVPETLEYQQKQAFCRTCTQNQLLYNETLANYLPEESDPRYREYEKAIPKYKAELEKRYPLVCKKCAPLAQAKINRADYYGLSQNAARLLAGTRKRGGLPPARTRDDWGKRVARYVLNLVGLALYLGLLFQLAYHLYGILATAFGQTDLRTDILNSDVVDSLSISPSAAQCARRAMRFSFPATCYQLFSNYVPHTLTIAACGIWYNPGLKAWYHHTHRMEAVHGQKEYFYMQVISLVIRTWAWFTLSNPKTTAALDREQLVAMHGFVLLFVLVTQAIANRNVVPVKWTMKGKIMPNPNDNDVLGSFAGPEPEHYTPRASEKDPWRYLRKEDTGPLDINKFAPTAAKPNTRRTSYAAAQQPSPELSDAETEFDPMETDYAPVMRTGQRYSSAHPSFTSQTSFGNPQPNNGTSLSFTGMTDHVYSMQDQMRQEAERRRQEQKQKLSYQPPKDPSPFFGSLPPAPMSLERRVRNPVLRPLQPEKIPLSQQKNFMSQMRSGVKPVQFPEKGSNFELKPSSWVLPSDVKETGLEERFGRTFSLADASPMTDKKGKGFLGGIFGR